MQIRVTVPEFGTKSDDYLSGFEAGAAAASDAAGSTFDVLREALKSSPDIAMHKPDDFFRLYTKWFEQTRRDALRQTSQI